MTLFACVFSVLLPFFLLALSNPTVSKEKAAQRSLKVSTPAELAHTHKNKRKFRKLNIKPQNKLLKRPSSLSPDTKKKKLIIKHKRKSISKKKPRRFKPVQQKHQRYKKIRNNGARLKKSKNGRSMIKSVIKHDGLKKFKTTALKKQPAFNSQITTTEKSTLETTLIMKEYSNGYTPPIDRRSFEEVLKDEYETRVLGYPDKKEFEKFIANNKDMLDHKYWRRRFEFYHFRLNEGVQEARENIRKHGGDPNAIPSQELCHDFFDNKCYQKGKKVCVEKDKDGDCKKWYHQPFRYDKSGKRELWIYKLYDKKPETQEERQSKQEDELRDLRYESCTIELWTEGGRRSVTKCVPVYKILRKYPRLAKKIKDFYPGSNPQQYADNAESIVQSIISAAYQKDCELLERLFPFLKGYFAEFSQTC